MATGGRDNDLAKGTVERSEPNQPSQTSLEGQLPHRTANPLVKDNDSDFPEPGGNPEHSGEQTSKANPEGKKQGQDPGQRKKRNQGSQRRGPLAG